MKKFNKFNFSFLSLDIMPIVLKIITISIVCSAIFFQDLKIIFTNALTSDMHNFSLIIPFIFIFLLYRKRKILNATIQIEQQQSPKLRVTYFPMLVGFLLFALSMILYFYGSYTHNPLEIHMLIFPVVIAALTLILFNFETLIQMLFPIVFLFFLVPPPADMLYILGNLLSVLSSKIVFGIINGVGIPSTLTIQSGNPTIVITRPDATIIPFSVDLACAGIYSLIGFVVFAFFIGYLIRDKITKKLIVFIIGFPLIFLLNLIRITSIIMVGYHFGEQLALEIFHLLGGWVLIFMGTILLLVISEKIFHINLIVHPEDQCTQCYTSQKNSQSFCTKCGKVLCFNHFKLSRDDINKILALILSIIIIVPIQVPVFALTDGGTINYNSVSVQMSTEIFPEIQGYNLSFRSRDFAYEKLVNHDLAVWYVYRPVDESVPQKVIHVGLEITESMSSMHSLYYCLHKQPIIDYGQPKVKTIEYKDIQLSENPPIVAKYFSFVNETTNQIEAAIWWYENPTFSINSTAKQKFARITLITYPANLDELSAMEDQFIAYAKSIVAYWEPLNSGVWSDLVISLSHNGPIIAGILILIILGLVVEHLRLKMKEKNLVSEAYDKISVYDQQIFDCVFETEKNTLPTLCNILSVYQKKAGSVCDKAQVLNGLHGLQKIGLLKKVVFNVNDQPIVGWKTPLSWNFLIDQSEKTKNYEKIITDTLKKTFEKLGFLKKPWVIGIVLIVCGGVLLIYTSLTILWHEQILANPNLSMEEGWRYEGAIQWWRKTYTTISLPLSVVMILFGLLTFISQLYKYVKNFKN